MLSGEMKEWSVKYMGFIYVPISAVFAAPLHYTKFPMKHWGSRSAKNHFIDFLNVWISSQINICKWGQLSVILTNIIYKMYR